MMFKYAILVVILYTQLLAKYDIGDTILPVDQDSTFSYCYPTDSTGTFSFSRHENKIFILEMSATW